MEQPNATGDEDAPLTPKFWLALAMAAVATGLFGAALMALLFSVQHLAFGYSTGSLEHAVKAASAPRRVVSLVAAGLFGGVAWYLLRRFTRGQKSDVDDAVWSGDAKLSMRRSLGTSVISEVVVGMGASIGREQAPKIMGAASGSVIALWLGLSDGQRRVLVACAAGSGLAAVYNVPLGGAFFTIEVLLGRAALPMVLPALACSFIATGTAWLFLPHHATYVDVPSYRFSVTIMVWSLVAGVAIGLAASAYIRLIGWVSFHRADGAKLVPAMTAAFAVLGLVGLVYPQLFGNGKDMAHNAFLGRGTIGLLLALSILKPLMTSLCLRGGASGGLFTPTFSTGAVFGAFLGIVWAQIWPGSPIGAYAMVGSAAMIGAAMQAPLAGLALVLELAHSGFGLMVPMIAATVVATAIARKIDGYSIYSARLPPEE